MRQVAVAGLILAPILALAQNELTGKDLFPQFRVLSGLPGGGFGIGKDGVPSINGALAFTTPIGYSLGARRFAVTFGSVSFDRRFRALDSGGSNTQGGSGNGTLAAMAGFEIPRWGRITISHTYLSSIGDNAQNLQWQLPLRLRHDTLGVSIGVQDITGKGGSSGENLPGDGASSRSFFVAGTIKAGPGHLSAGIGTRRFRNGFASYSVPLANRFNALLEYEGWHWNAGLAIRLGEIGGNPRVQAVSTFGLVRGKYAFWNLSFAF
ncbi:MAG: hypothetical protein HONBIEJF_01644 [Fimbriimonadaceae bacterium]|nr:hypothetical protein [Fimbriimonadaceae bacterium]